MTKYYTYGGVRYRVVPALLVNHCGGCRFDVGNKTCPNSTEPHECENGELAGSILIEDSNTAVAAYAAKVLEKDHARH